MDSKLEAKMNMYDAVLAHCNANPLIVNSVPAFQTAVTTFRDIFEDLTDATQAEIQIISGITVDKAEQRKTLVQLAFDMAGQIFAFASATDNHILKGQVSYVFSDLNRLKDELLAPACQNILAAANANAVALVPYGVTAAKITELDDAISDYAAAVPGPRNAVSQRAAITNTIKDLFKSGDEMLKEQLDKLVIQFKTTEPEFYNAYKNNRVLLDPAVSSTQVAGTVVSQSGNIPLNGVTITVTGQDYTTTSDNLGEYKLKIPAPGTYEIKFSKPDYFENTIENITVTLGQTTPLDVSLQATPS